jgi:gas vesicle protein
MRGGTILTGLIGAILGAIAMFLWDPRGGKRRRAMWREQATSRCRGASEAVAAHSRDITNRARGVMSDLKASSDQEGEASDEVLKERVRSRLGHLATHAHSLEVTVDDGVATIAGPIAEGASAALVQEISLVPGLKGVQDELSEESAGESTPTLRPHRRRGWFRTGAAEPLDRSEAS